MSLPAVQPGLLLILIPLLPLAGAVTLWCGAWCGLRTPGRSIALLASGLSLLAIVAALVVSGAGEVPRTLTCGRWLALRGGAAGTIELSLQWDGLAALWLLVQNAAALLVLLCTGEREQTAGGGRLTAAWSLGLLGVVNLLALAGNYWLFFVCWELSLIAAWRLLASQAENEFDARSAYRMLWTGLIGDLPLLIGLLAIWQAFGTFEFRAVLQGGAAEASALHPSAEVMRGFASFCLVIAALCRCAQFPACNWLPPAASTRSVATLWGILAGVLPAGTLLLLRSAPLLDMSPTALTLLVNWSCLSAAVWGCLALTQSDSRRELASFVTGTFGLACAGIGAKGESGLASAMFLAGNLIVMPAVLSCGLSSLEQGNVRAKPRRRQRSAACLAIALASGMWGQEAVLRELWTSEDARVASQQPASANEETAAAQPAISHNASLAAPLAAVFAHLLLSVGLFRALFRRGPESVENEIAGSARFDRGTVISTITAAVFVPILFVLRPQWGWQAADGRSAASQLVQLCMPGMTVLVMLLALLLARLLEVQSPEARARLANTFDSLVRLSRRGFYVDQACWICCGLPLSICANVCRFLEDHVWERELLGEVDGISTEPDADTRSRSLMPVLALFVAAGAVLVVLLLEG